MACFLFRISHTWRPPSGDTCDPEPPFWSGK